MTITAAHVPAIVALIAGILILLMPRLLNFIVAIYLIFVGFGRSRHTQDVSPVELERRVSQLARNPSKWCKARIFFPLFGLL